MMRLWREKDERLGPAKLPWPQIPAPEMSERGFWVALGVALLPWGLLIMWLFWGAAP